MSTTRSRLRASQEHLLAQLVEAVRAVVTHPWEHFVAVRVGLAGIVIYHPSTDPITAEDMADLDALAELELIDLTRTPSGARIFDLTRRAFEHYDAHWPATPA